MHSGGFPHTRAGIRRLSYRVLFAGFCLIGFGAGVPVLLMAASPAAGDGPSPSAVGAADGIDRDGVIQLVRDLNHPQFSRRQAAATALMNLGEPVLDLLAELREQPPSSSGFETQVAIDQIIRDIRQSLRGVAIVYLTADGPALQKGVQLGDVFVAVDGVPTVDAETLLEAEVRDYRNRPRTVRIRRGNQFLEVPFDAGKYGVIWTNYEASYGPHLSTALRAYAEKDYRAGSQAFEAAIAAGLQAHEDGMLRSMYLACGYYSRMGQEGLAWLTQVFRDEISHARGHSFWRILPVITQILPMVAPGDEHLAIRILEAVMAADPDARNAQPYLAHIHINRTRRYGEAAAVALSALSGEGELRPEIQAWTLHALAMILAELGAEDELRATLKRLAEHELGGMLWSWHAISAERLGEWELSAKVMEGVLANQPPDRAPLWAVQHLLRLSIRENCIDEARELLMDQARNASTFVQLNRDTLQWSRSCGLWAEAAREAVETGPESLALLRHAFGLLVFQPSPNLEELESLQARMRRVARSSRSRSLLDYNQARIEVVRGDYEQALELFQQILSHSRSRTMHMQWGIHGERDAAAFLLAHGQRLSGEQARWRQTMYAFPVPDGRTYLITREQRIGRLEPDGEIHEVPAPDDWWPWLQQAIVASPSGRTILLTSNDEIHRLEDDAWVSLTRLPAADWGLVNLAPVLDELVEMLEQRDAEARAIVLPKEFQAGLTAPPPFMLGDGTWLMLALHDAQSQEEAPAGRLIDVTAELSRMVGRRVLIHDMVAGDETGSLYYLATDSGLFGWTIADSEFTAIPLPGRKDPAAVMLLDGELPPARQPVRRIAVLPQEGGQIYRLHLGTGEIEAEPGINESLPEAYWRARPVRERVALTRAAVEKAGIEWPGGR